MLAGCGGNNNNGNGNGDYENGGESEVASFTVTFNTQGGSIIQSQTITSGGFAGRPSNPTKDGYNFIDWYTHATEGEVFVFTTPITADRTLFAQWDEIEIDTGPAMSMARDYVNTLKQDVRDFYGYGTVADVFVPSDSSFRVLPSISFPIYFGLFAGFYISQDGIFVCVYDEWPNLVIGEQVHEIRFRSGQHIYNEVLGVWEEGEIRIDEVEIYATNGYKCECSPYPHNSIFTWLTLLQCVDFHNTQAGGLILWMLSGLAIFVDGYTIQHPFVVPVSVAVFWQEEGGVEIVNINDKEFYKVQGITTNSAENDLLLVKYMFANINTITDDHIALDVLQQLVSEWTGSVDALWDSIFDIAFAKFLASNE
jgi:uncharacterized repeat protein (TIGR02543 family)